MLGRKQLKCSFCRKNDSEVQKLVAGPGVYICDECVTIAKRLMDSETPASDAPSKNGPVPLIGADGVVRIF